MLAPTWVTAGLRALLRNAARFPGRLYQPILIENVPSGDALLQEAAQLAELEKLLVVRELDMGQVEDLPSRALWVLSMANLPLLPRDFFRSVPPECQVILWTSDLGVEIPAGFEGWVQSGMRYLATRSTARSQRFDEVGSTLTLSLRKPGEVYNPVVVVAEPRLHDLLAVGSLIRLEAARLSPVLDLVGPFEMQARAAGTSPGARAAGWVVRLQDYAPSHAKDEAFFRAMKQSISEGVQVVLVLDPLTQQRMMRSERWALLLSEGTTLNLEPGEAPVLQEPEPMTLLKEDAFWPPLREVMAGKPEQSPSVGTPPFTGNLEDAAALAMALQWVYMLRRTGRLVVFSDTEHGYIDFEQGWVIHAGPSARWFSLPRLLSLRTQDEDLTPEVHEGWLASAMEARICDMADWKDARFVFFDTTPSPPSEERTHLSPEALAMEIARRFDEKPRMVRHTGGLGRVWVQVEESPPSPEMSVVARVLWNSIDGEQRLGDLARSLCLTEFEALEAADQLVRAHHIFIVQDLDWSAPSESSAGVIRALWKHGLHREAKDLLDKVIGSGNLAPEMLWLCAWTLVEKGEWEEALQVFEEAAQLPEGEERLCAEINATLIGVRLGRIPAATAHGILLGKGCLSHVAAGLVDLAPACAEICIRAQRIPEARAFMEHVSDPSIASLLEESMATFRPRS